MKVAILKSGLRHVGGLEKNTRGLAHAFADRGHDVTILTSKRRRDEGDLEQPSQHRVVSLHKQTWAGFANRLKFDRLCQEWLRDNPHQIVFGMDRNTHQTHYRVGEGVHRAYLNQRIELEPLHKRLSFPINPLHRANLKLERATFTDPALRTIITNSNLTRDELLAHYPVDPAKVHVVHNGVTLRNDYWPDQRSTDRHHFLFVGHGWRRKGLAQLLMALSLLPNDSYQLTVIGREERQKPYLEQIQRLGLQNNVHLLGSVNPHPHYQQADTLLIPSLYDPFANVTVEALGMGLRVLSSYFNGGKEVLTPETGALFPSLDPDAMAATLTEALDKPKTPASAITCRESICHLDFALQLQKIVDLCLPTATT